MVDLAGEPVRTIGRFWRVYVLPAAVFQSVMIGGGYGTGREVVEYFTRFGLLGGLLGFSVVIGCFSLLLGLSYDFARTFQAYDYRCFFQKLLGRGWIAFELLYIAMFALVLGVISAAAGQMFELYLNVPGPVGGATLLLVVTCLAFFGRHWVIRILAFKAGLLSLVFLTYFAGILLTSADKIAFEVGRFELIEGWLTAAFRYVLYSSVVVPAMLFATSAISSRREAYLSGALGAITGMIPGVLLHLSFAVGYPAVLQESIPVHWMILQLGLPSLMLSVLRTAYLLVLFGCLLDTALCFVQSVNERIDGWRRDLRRAPASRWTRAGVATLCVVASGGLSFFGVVRLVADGYSTMAWGFLILYIAPLFTLGLLRIFYQSSDEREPIRLVAPEPAIDRVDSRSAER